MMIDSYEAIRDSVIERDDFRCQMCGCGRDLEVHHILPRHLGGMDCSANLITLCKYCHDHVHGRVRCRISEEQVEFGSVAIS